MNISQHAIIPLGFPPRSGYYQASGVYNPSTSLISLGLSPQFGMNRAFNCVPFGPYGLIRNFDVINDELTNGGTSSFIVASQVINVAVRDVMSFITQRTGINYVSYMPYVFWLMYKSNIPPVTSLSFGNLLTLDTID